MRKIIHRLRNKSEEERRHILHLLMIGFAVILIAAWVYSLGRTITSEDTKIKVKEDLKPFTEFKDKVIDITDNNN
jgi:hypothetical protein